MLIAFQELQEPKDCQTMLQFAGKVKPVVMQNISFGFPEAFKIIGGPNLVPMLMILNEALLWFWSAANREAAIFNSQDHHHNTKWIHIQYRKSIVVQYKMLWSRCLWYVYGVFVFLIKWWNLSHYLSHFFTNFKNFPLIYFCLGWIKRLYKLS